MKVKKNQKQVSIEEYVETYCHEKRIRERFAVYVSPQTHGKLKSIVRLFYSKHHTTTSSLADSIISCHFEEHRELLNNVQKEDRRELLEWLNGMKRCEMEHKCLVSEARVCFRMTKTLAFPEVKGKIAPVGRQFYGRNKQNISFI